MNSRWEKRFEEEILKPCEGAEDDPTDLQNLEAKLSGILRR